MLAMSKGDLLTGPSVGAIERAKGGPIANQGAIDRTSQATRPRGRPAGFQRWRNLLFVHWDVPAEAVRDTLPPHLELDTFDGRAWLGAVAFTMRDVSPWWSPSVPGISNFHELNLRTYVLHNGEPGVWFYSLDAAASIAVIIARLGWKLPYHRARMQLDVDASDVRYTSQRRWPGPTPADFSAHYTIGEPRGIATPGTLEHFLVERYLLFTVGGGGQILRGHVHHEPYPLFDVKLHDVQESLIAAAGIDGRPEAHATVHYSPGVDVDVYALAPTAVP